MIGLADAKQAVAGYFNSHVRRGDRVSEPARFLTDSRGTLDSAVSADLNQFLIDVLGMGERLQGAVTTCVNVGSVNCCAHIISNYGDLPIVAALKERPVSEWFVSKNYLHPEDLRAIDMVFDDDESFLNIYSEIGVVAALNPKSSNSGVSECADLLSAWAALGESSEGREAQEQIFQAWYDGQQFEIK